MSFPSRAVATLVCLVVLAACTHSAQPVAAPTALPTSLPPSPTPSSPPPTPSPPPLGKPVHWISGWLHTEGTQIVTEDRHPVRLLGIGITGMQQGSGTPNTQPQPYSGCLGWHTPDPVAYGQIKSWGFNMIRLPVSWANLEPSPPTKGSDGTLVHHWNKPYLAALDGIVNGFAKKGVATVIDMNQVRWSPAFTHIPLPSGGKICGTGLPAWLYPGQHGIDALAEAEEDFFIRDKGGVQERFVDAWAFLVRHYRKQQMMVGADILCESYDILVTSYPGGTQLLPKDIDLQGFYEKVGRAINQANPNLLIIFEDNRSKRTTRWSVVGKPDLPNMVLSAHYYPAVWDAPEGKPRLEQYVERARGWDMPLWLGEFNAMHYTTSFPVQPNWASDTKKFLVYAKQNEISWTIWAYGSGQFQIKGTTTPKPGIVDVLRTGY